MLDSGHKPIANPDDRLRLILGSNLKDLFFTDGDNALRFIEGSNVSQKKELVQKAIKTNNIKKVAREAGIPRSTLQKWLRTHELQAFKTSNGGI